MVGQRTRDLDLQQQIGAAVLERLEGTDRPPELEALLRVVHRGLEQVLRAADHLVGQRGGHEVPEPVERFAVYFADCPARNVGERDPGQLARQVHHLERLDLEASRAGLHGVETKARVHPRDHDQQIGHMGVDDHRGRSGESAGVRRADRAADPGRAVQIVEDQRRDHGTGRDSRKQLGPRGFLRRLDQRVAGHHGRSEERTAEQRPPHLLGDDAEFDRPAAGAAVGFGNVDAGQSRIPAEFLPDGRIVAPVRRHRLANGRGRRLVAKRPRHDIAEKLLLARELRLHPSSSVSIGFLQSLRPSLREPGTAA